MKDFDGVIIFLAIVGVAGFLFWGLRTVLKKSLNTAPKYENAESDQKLKNQRERIQDTEERRKQLMRDQQQKLRDYRQSK